MKKLWTLRRIVGGPVSLAAVMTVSSIGLPDFSMAQEKSVVAQTEKVNRLIDEVVSADVELEVTKRRSKILRLKQDVFRVAVADPSLIDFVGFGSREVEIIGKEVGSTTVTFWVGKEENAQLLSVLVTVVRDDAMEDQGRKDFADLNSLVNEMFPNSRIQLIPIADKVIIRGQARDEQEAVQIMSVIRKNADLLPGGIGGSGGTSGGAASDPFPDTRQSGVQRNLVNMLRIPGEKQVLLKVRIAELKRSATRDLGVNFDFNIKEFMMSSALTSGANVMASGTFSDSSFNLALKALVTNGSAKILAEPNLVALSGHSATFLSGGEFPVPTVVGIGGAQAATTSFKGFGTSLSFLPTVLDKDRIRLEVTPTLARSIKPTRSAGYLVSTRDRPVRWLTCVKARSSPSPVCSKSNSPVPPNDCRTSAIGNCSTCSLTRGASRAMKRS